MVAQRRRPRRRRRDRRHASADEHPATENTGTVIASNDDWGGTSVLKNACAAVGAGALAADTSKDAALLVTLPPGVYSAHVSGVGGTTGVALAEIFLMP